MPAANSVEPVWKIWELPCGCWRPAIPGGMVQHRAAVAGHHRAGAVLRDREPGPPRRRRVARVDEIRIPGDAARREPVRADRLPAVAPVAGFEDAVGLVKPADQVGGVVGIDRQRVQADIELGLDERRSAVDGLEDRVVGRRPDRGGRRPRHRDHVAARDVGERVVDQRPAVAVVRRLPEPRAAAADIDVARPRRIAGDAARAVHVGGRAENGGHAGRRDVDPHAGRARRRRDAGIGRQRSGIRAAAAGEHQTRHDDSTPHADRAWHPAHRTAGGRSGNVCGRPVSHRGRRADTRSARP